MSYSVDLWSSYNKVEKRLELNYRGLKDFINIISQYYAVLNEFTFNLKKIYDLKCNTSNESLQTGINGFKADIFNQYLALTDYLTNIKEDLISPLTTVKEEILEKIKNNLRETSSMEKAYRTTVLQMDSMKKKFYSSIKDLEQCKIKNELLKDNQVNKDENNYEDYNLIEENELKIISLVKTAKENEKNYISFIDSTNIMQDEYIEIKKRNLNEIQNLEELLANNMKDCLRKYVIFKISYLRNLQYDIDKKANIMENIDIRKDIYDYINKNSTNAIPPEKYSYLPYLCDVGIKNNLFIKKEIINEVNNFINTAFNIKNAMEIMEIKPKNIANIETLANNSFLNKNLTNEEKREVILFSSFKNTRRYLLEQLNKFRIKNGLNLSDISYNNIGDILKNCLSILEKEVDFESYKIIIILSSSLYKTSEETNKSRIFLHNYLLDFPLWKKFSFWKDLINYEIIEEMIKQKKYNMLDKENEQYKLKRIQLIVKSKLNTYLFNMITFGADNMTMYDIIEFFKNYYFLDKSTVDLLNNIIKNYSQNKNDIQNTIIEKKKDDTISDINTKNETIISNSNEDNEEIEIVKNCTFNIEGNILNGLIQKQPCDNILKAKRRQKQSLNNKYKNNQNLENLNINLIIKDNNNNDDKNSGKGEIEKEKNNQDVNESMKNKKKYNDEYKEEDIVSKIALTEFSIDKNEENDSFFMKEKQF